MFLCPLRNPSASLQGAAKAGGDPNRRIHNLSLLVQRIKTYYQVRLLSPGGGGWGRGGRWGGSAPGLSCGSVRPELAALPSLQISSLFLIPVP